MSEISRVIRLRADGDPGSGMTQWQPITGDSVVGGDDPRDRFHRFLVASRGNTGEMHVGVWEATAYSERVVDYPCDEIMFVLEGSVTVIDEDGHEETFKQGDCFFMPLGYTGLWKQDETMKKFHMSVYRP